LLASLLIVIRADRAPVVDGVKVTLTVQLPPAEIVEHWSGVKLKSLEFPPLNEKMTPEIANFPAFETAIEPEELLPTIVSAKVKSLGTLITEPNVDLPYRETEFAVEVPEAEIVSEPVSLSTTVGL